MSVHFGKAQLAAVGKSTGGSYINHWQTFDPTGKTLKLSNKTNAWLFTGDFKEIMALVAQVKSFDYKDGGNTNIAFSAWKPGDIQGIAEIMGHNLLKLVPIPAKELTDIAGYLVRLGVKALVSAAKKDRLLKSLNPKKQEDWAFAVFHAAPSECTKLYSNVDVFWKSVKSVAGPDMASVMLQWKDKQGKYTSLHGIFQKGKQAIRGGEKNYQATGDDLLNYHNAPHH